MISLMRDTYVDIDGVGYAKLNAAYAYGAGPLLCQTVTDTFRVQVDRYVAVDFWSLVEYHRYHRRRRSGDHGQRGRGRKWIYQ